MASASHFFACAELFFPHDHDWCVLQTTAHQFLTMMGHCKGTSIQLTEACTHNGWVNTERDRTRSVTPGGCKLSFCLSGVLACLTVSFLPYRSCCSLPHRPLTPVCLSLCSIQKQDVTKLTLINHHIFDTAHPASTVFPASCPALCKDAQHKHLRRGCMVSKLRTSCSANGGLHTAHVQEKHLRF